MSESAMGQPGSTLYKCPLCEWAYEVPSTVAGGIAPDVMTIEHALQEHVSTHELAEWVREVQRLRDALHDAREGLDEMLPYVPEYFQDKWELPAYVSRATAALG